MCLQCTSNDRCVKRKKSSLIMNLRADENSHARAELTDALTLARQVQQSALVAEAAWWIAELERLEGLTELAFAGFMRRW